MHTGNEDSIAWFKVKRVAAPRDIGRPVALLTAAAGVSLCSSHGLLPSTFALEKLYGALVLLGCTPCRKRPKVPALAGSRVRFARIQPELP
jgi:hypothetical protein